MMNMIDPNIAKAALKQIAEDQLSYSETDALPDDQPRQPGFFARLLRRASHVSSPVQLTSEVRQPAQETG